MSKESYARGFVKAAQAHGVDPQALAKFAAEDDLDEMLPTRSLDRSERKSLLADLPDSRKKQIVKFLLEELAGEGSDKRYIVTAKDHDKSRGEYTYIPSKDKLYESALQKIRNERKRNFRARTRLAWLGF